MNLIHPTQHEKAEWIRMATDAYSRGLNFYGHRYSVAATWNEVRQDVFDTLQFNYRTWLNNGWSDLT